MWKARSRALWFAVTLCTVNLSACNTVEGFGTDMQNLGQKIARKIDQKQARSEPTVPATRRVVERKSSEDRENQEREGKSPDNEVDYTQNELDRMYEEQMQRRAQ
ncbi:MAG: hypothetical protein ACREV1_14290 [Gammaproteobacteria bacterium]